MQEIVKGMANASDALNGNFTKIEEFMNGTPTVSVNQDAITGGVRYYVKNGLLVLSIGHSALTSELAGHQRATLFTLPVHLRPKLPIYNPLQTDSDSAAAILEVNTDGVVSIFSRQPETIPTNIAFRGGLVFPV